MRMTAIVVPVPWTYRIQGCGAILPRPKAGSPLKLQTRQRAGAVVSTVPCSGDPFIQIFELKSKPVPKTGESLLVRDRHGGQDLGRG